MNKINVIQRTKTYIFFLFLTFIGIWASTSLAAVMDFSGEGRTDILWQETSSGTVAIWLMNGAAISSIGVAGSTPSDWQIKGVGDFNGDGKADVLWQHTSSGTVAIWLMNGTAISSIGVAGSVPSDWQIKGVGDFNGDGKADVLWQHTSSGTVAIWLMNGTAISSIGVAGSVPSDWQIKGVGDFNGGGKADVLWQHTSSGTVAIWLMNGTTISSIGVAGTVSSDWQIKGVGDFDGNSRADILWQQTSGAVAIWLMNGTAVSSIGVAGTVSSDWQIKGVGDFNGNLRADILWQQISGAVAIWLMNGTAVSSIGVAGSVGIDWQIKPGSQTTPPPPRPVLTGPSTVNTTVGFLLTWTYTFGGLASTQEGYQLQESTDASFSSPTTIFNTINQNDNISPKNLIVTGKSTAGTYYYRVRAYDYPLGLTGWSNTLTVTVLQPAARILRIINDLYDQAGADQLNQIIRVRIASTQAQVSQAGNTYERLAPDDTIWPYINMENMVTISPKYNQTTSYRDFNIDSLGLPTLYYVFIQCGWWDFCLCTEYYCPDCLEKHMTETTCCNCTSPCYKWAIFYVNHSSGRVDVRASQFLPLVGYCNQPAPYCQ